MTRYVVGLDIDATEAKAAAVAGLFALSLTTT